MPDTDTDSDIAIGQLKAKVKRSGGVNSSKKRSPERARPPDNSKMVKTVAPAARKEKDKKAMDTKKENRPQPRPKKEYDMPGQTRDTPPENDSLRRFYTSLLVQKPTSEMAKKYCVMHGLLSKEEAEAWLAEQAVKKGKSPVKSKSKGTGQKNKTGDTNPRSASNKKTSENIAGKKSKVQKDAKTIKQRSSSIVKTTMSKAQKESQSKRTKSKRDVAFLDGGLDDGSDSEDIPLLQMRKKQKS